MTIIMVIINTTLDLGTLNSQDNCLVVFADDHEVGKRRPRQVVVTVVCLNEEVPHSLLAMTTQNREIAKKQLLLHNHHSHSLTLRLQLFPHFQVLMSKFQLQKKRDSLNHCLLHGEVTLSVSQM